MPVFPIGLARNGIVPVAFVLNITLHCFARLVERLSGLPTGLKTYNPTFVALVLNLFRENETGQDKQKQKHEEKSMSRCR
ncbi:hypothetical protein SNOG_06546 [Parastagonospora nodorum SN15]|uniref:Uncharacterized protein n=1 Tax=Phaeosphaeria nodorum (strain SN15 / ATCC MYA-4574 / FGSC 10173) TaxID=321614 RepID=Q0UNW8_PHANO|nr:hypothetical protein SNOG_06546 [Parastagonospora nodorum SN15]EAT86377.1 hypothetical protein SNOG_06546 [Parastagonospora nodorum SN15]